MKQNVKQNKARDEQIVEAKLGQESYCEIHKTVNTRNIYGMLLCCEK